MAQEKFILVGPNAGKSGVWGGYAFENGICIVQGQIEGINAAAGLLSRFYGAYPATIAAAMKARGVTDPALLDVEAEEVPTVEPLLPQELTLAEKIAEALKKLDPANDDHWTSNNLPALDEIGELLGQDVTRAQVNEVAQGYTRAAARAAAK
jgi:hypothetical protein